MLNRTTHCTYKSIVVVHFNDFFWSTLLQVQLFMRSPWRGQVCVQENGLIGLNHWKQFRGPGAESPSSGIVLICRKLHPKPPWKNECQKNLFKIQFLKTVPQIKYDHTFKGFFDWRQLFFFAGEHVVLVVLVALVVSGVQRVDCVTFCTSERGREREIEGER